MMVIDIDIADDAWIAEVPDAGDRARRAARAALGTRGGELAILLTGDETLRDLNRRFRGQDAPTNVLSFAALANERGWLGDIALAFSLCAQEARDQGKPLADHLSHLVIHGVLHLLGYDHQDVVHGEIMETRERDLLASLSVPDPYSTIDAWKRDDARPGG